MNKFSMRRFSVLLVLSLAVLLVPCGRPASADGWAMVLRIEEDWSLVVNQPSWDIASPQVSTQMKRSPDVQRFCNFHLNSLDIPQYSQGGLQLQVWNGSTNLAAVPSNSRNIMDTTNETITWTQYMDNTKGQMHFGISASSSQTWGDFSGLDTVMPGSGLSLDGYSTDYSVQNSGITFGANRVTSLTLNAIRWYYSDGTVQTDNTQRVVYPAPAPTGTLGQSSTN